MFLCLLRKLKNYKMSGVGGPRAVEACAVTFAEVSAVQSRCFAISSVTLVSEKHSHLASRGLMYAWYVI